MLFWISKIQPEELYCCLSKHIQVTEVRRSTGYVLSSDAMGQWLKLYCKNNTLSVIYLEKSISYTSDHANETLDGNCMLHFHFLLGNLYFHESVKTTS